MPERLRVLCYHSVEDRVAFARQMDTVRRLFHPVTLNQVEDAVVGRRPLPSRPVLVTFDDGLPSHVDVAGPVLAERGISGVFFIVLGVLGTLVPFWWDAVEARRAALASRPFVHGGTTYVEPAPLVSRLKILPDCQRLAALRALTIEYGPPPPTVQLTVDQCRSLVQSGHALGNHSWSHPLLDRLDDEALKAELGRAHDAYLERFPDQPKSFAYPNGNHDPRVVEWLRSHGYTTAFLFDHGICGLDRPLEVSRLRVHEKVPSMRWVSTLVGVDSLRVRFRPGAVAAAQRRGVGGL